MKKGFTLIELLAVIAVLAIVLLIAVPNIIDVIKAAKSEALVKSENSFKKAAINYLAANQGLMPALGQSIEISLNELIANKYIDPIKDPKDGSDCSGYIIVTNIANKPMYNSHLKCDATINTAIEDSLVIDYAFDNFEEPTANLATLAVDGLNGISYSYIGEENGYRKYSINGTWNSGTYPYSFSLSPIMYTAGISYSVSAKIYTNVPEKFATLSGINMVNDASMTGARTSTVDGEYMKREDYIHSVNMNNAAYVNSKPLADGTAFNPTTDFLYIKEVQIESKPYSTAYTSSARTGTIKNIANTSYDISLPLLTTPKWIDGYYNFDGGNDYFQIPDFSLSSNVFTMNVFMNPSVTGSGSGMFITPNSNGLDQRITYDYANSRIVMSLASASDTNERSIATTSNSVAKNIWSMLTVVINNQNVKIYINGQLKLESNETLPIGLWNGFWNFGQRGNTTNYYKGDLDDLVIYKRILSTDEISDMYSFKKNNYK